MFVPQGVEELREAEGKERKTNWPCAVISRNKSTIRGEIYSIFISNDYPHSSTDVQ